MTEQEQQMERCGPTHHTGCTCHEVRWAMRLKQARMEGREEAWKACWELCATFAKNPETVHLIQRITFPQAEIYWAERASILEAEKEGREP